MLIAQNALALAKLTPVDFRDHSERELIIQPAHYSTPGDSELFADCARVLGGEYSGRFHLGYPGIEAGPGDAGGFYIRHQATVIRVMHKRDGFGCEVLREDVESTKDIVAALEDELRTRVRGPGTGTEHAVTGCGISLAVTGLGRVYRAEDRDAMALTETRGFAQEGGNVVMVDDLALAEFGESVDHQEREAGYEALAYGKDLRERVIVICGGGGFTAAEEFGCGINNREVRDGRGDDANARHGGIDGGLRTVAGYEGVGCGGGWVGEYRLRGGPVGEYLQHQRGFTDACGSGDYVDVVDGEDLVN